MEKKVKTEAQKRASAKWESHIRQRIIRLTPEKDKALVERAKETGESINGLLNRIIDEELNKIIQNS